MCQLYNLLDSCAYPRLNIQVENKNLFLHQMCPNIQMFGVVIDKTSRRLIAFFYWPLTCFDMIGDVMSLELYIKVPSLIYPIVYIVSHLPRGENASMVKQKEI